MFAFSAENIYLIARVSYKYMIYPLTAAYYNIDETTFIQYTLEKFFISDHLNDFTSGIITLTAAES